MVYKSLKKYFEFLIFSMFYFEDFFKLYDHGKEKAVGHCKYLADRDNQKI